MKAVSISLTCCLLVLLNSTAFSAPVTADTTNNNVPRTFTISPGDTTSNPSSSFTSRELTPLERKTRNNREGRARRKAGVWLRPKMRDAYEQRHGLTSTTDLKPTKKPFKRSKYRWQELEGESPQDYRKRVILLNAHERALDALFYGPGFDHSRSQPPPEYEWTHPNNPTVHDVEALLLHQGIIPLEKSNIALPVHWTHTGPRIDDFEPLLELHGILDAATTFPLGRNSDSLVGTSAQPAPAVIDLAQDSKSLEILDDSLDTTLHL